MKTEKKDKGRGQGRLVWLRQGTCFMMRACSLRISDWVLQSRRTSHWPLVAVCFWKMATHRAETEVSQCQSFFFRLCCTTFGSCFLTRDWTWTTAVKAQNPDPYAIRELPSVALDLDWKEDEHSVPNSGNVPKTRNSWKNIHKTIAK